MQNELAIAKAIAAGQEKSPRAVEGTNYIFVAMRITGTGYAYRDKSETYIYRDPKDYLTGNVLDMCNGLPVIIKHVDDPKGLNEETNVIGSIFYPYIKDTEVWGIAKIWGVEALTDIIDMERISTSCSFICKTTKKDSGGETIKQDQAPLSCNHIAILPGGLMGVWDKYNPETTAIQLFNDSQKESTMSDIQDSPTQEEGGGNQATLEKILSVAQKALDAVETINARVEKLEQGGAAPEAEAEQATAPVVKEDDAEAEAEAAAKEPEGQTIAELAEKIAELDKASYGAEDDAQEKAELLEDSAKMHFMFKTPLLKSPPSESAGALRRRLFKAECEAAKALSISSPWLNESIEALNDSTLAIAHGQLKTQIFSAKPMPVEGELSTSFVKKGQGGLANETHFVTGDRAGYFQSY